MMKLVTQPIGLLRSLTGRAFIACAVTTLLTATPVQAADTLEYNRDIRPILADNCFSCHGPDSAARKGDLRLDERQAAVDRGAIVAGDPESSELIRRLLSEDPEEVMPPPETKKKVSPEQIEKLRRWLASGADYQLHWSFIPPVRAAIPDATQIADGQHAAWPRNPIDHFALERMVSAGLTPAPDADPHTIARRVSLDLTGLPPQPELVQRFIAEATPPAGATPEQARAQLDAAYERLVETLLNSQDWGEHRGRYWLDYARYADTHGIHFDNYREMWAYRDWVIRAFNANMPYDQFTIENLAGDLLPNATLDQIIGSGFNRCNMTTNEGGIIDEEYLVLYTRDRTETTAQVWMGLTAGCAVCHSHKFDPLSQKEFYEMAAFFNNTTQGARDGNIQDTPPIVVVPQATDRARWEALPREIGETKAQIVARREGAQADFANWLATITPEALAAALPKADMVLHAPLDEGDGMTTEVSVAGQPVSLSVASGATWRDGAIGKALQIQGSATAPASEPSANPLQAVGDFDSQEAFTCAAWVNLPASDGYGAICARMEAGPGYKGWDFWAQRRTIGMHMVNSWPDQGFKVVAESQIPADQWVHVAVSYDGSGKAGGVKVYYNGELQKTNVENDRLSGSIRTSVPLKIGQRDVSEPLTGSLQDLRIYRSALPAGEVAALAKLSHVVKAVQSLPQPPTVESLPDRDGIYNFWLSAFDATYRDLTTRVAALESEQNSIKSRGTIAHVMNEKAEEPTAYVLFRGEYDQRREEVKASTPDVLPEFPAEAPKNRLGFARWLLSDQHPLTARVTVNRYWQEVFGTGLVKTAGDFGVSGELPSHPELLDWLAVEFRESGWDVKRLFRLMVTSSTYRQAATATAEKLERDPENRLLARGPRFRMDAEMVRDYALSVSGLLVQRIGGPSVKPYQPPGVWEAIAMDVSNTRSYQPGSGEDLYRRSLYTFVKRMAPPASMEIFNAPNREICVVRRERTNTALQSLVTLNDPQFIEAARHLAQIALQTPELTFEQRLSQVSWRLLGREFRPEEITIIRDSWNKLQQHYQAHPSDAAELLDVGEQPIRPEFPAGDLAAWTMLCNQLMNLDEVLNK